MSICIMKGCPNRQHVYRNINFFKLPPTYAKRKRWLQLCEAEDADLTSESPVVCAEHFDPSYVSRKANKLILHPDALPTPIKCIPKDSAQAIELDILQQFTNNETIIAELIVLQSKTDQNNITDIDTPVEEFPAEEHDESELESSQMGLESSQLELEPADYYDVRCGEVFLSYTGVLAFHCSPCEKECGNFYSFVKHLKAEHYGDLKDDQIFNEFEHKSDDRFNESLSLDNNTCEESNEIKQEDEPNNLHKFVKIEVKPTIEQEAVDPLNEIEQILIEETTTDKDIVQIEYEDEEKTVELSDVLSGGSDKLQDKEKSLSDAENSLDSEMDAGSKKNFKCDVCKKTFVNAQVLKRHHEIVHSVVQKCKCEICGLKLKHSSYLRPHMLRHTGEKNIPCDICSKKFYTISEQRLHLRSHGLTYVRPKTTAPKDTNSEMVECDICKKTLKNKQTLKKHLDLVHSSSDQKYKCEICGLTLKHFSYIKAHMLRHTGEKNICCDICSKKFYTLSEQKLHLRTHNPKESDKPMETFQCNICKNTFKTKLTLKKHARVHTTTERKYKCNICGLGLKHYSYMKRHMLRHTGEKNISCEICSKKFYTPSEHKLHLRSHTGERPFVCSSCGLAFTNSGALTVHEKIHKIEPLFRCQYCNKGFYSAYRMKGHMIVHTKEKPFTCPICSASFPRKRSMLRHIDLRHKKNSKTNENDEELSC